MITRCITLLLSLCWNRTMVAPTEPRLFKIAHFKRLFYEQSQESAPHSPLMGADTGGIDCTSGTAGAVLDVISGMTLSNRLLPRHRGVAESARHHRRGGRIVIAAVQESG